VEWANPADPTKGFKYLYLSPADYASLVARGKGATVLKAERLVTEAGEERYQLTGGCTGLLCCLTMSGWTGGAWWRRRERSGTS